MSSSVKKLDYPLTKFDFSESYRTLGRSQLKVSPICFGSLRLTPQNGLYKQTLYQALEGGLRFIDTSGSYGNGASEILIGEVMSEFMQNNPEIKNEMVLSTKIGQVQGATLQELSHRQFLGQKIDGLHKINDKLSYCLSPEYIESQLSSSLVRLQVNCLDMVLIQNPEYLFKTLKTKENVYKYLRTAFEHLEVQVMRGTIKHYGISSSAFLKKEIANDYLNLKEIYGIAESITKNHHFSILQFPFNLFESTPLFIPNQDGQTLFEAAKKYDLGVMTVRPLTSHHRDKVHHFITFPGKDEVSVKGRLHGALLDVIELEKQLMAKLPQHNELKWGHLLRNHLHKISDWWRWNLYLQKQVLPSLQTCIDRLPSSQEWNRWKIHYVNQTHTLFGLITDSLQAIANLRTNQICLYLDKNCKELSNDEKLSNKVTRLYLSLPHIHSIVMGLSAPEHIQDVLSMGTATEEDATMDILTKVKMHF